MRFLFPLTVVMALALLAGVFLAPVLGGPNGGHGLVRLFAHDGTVRRTAVASAFGMIVTACVFFRPPGERG